MWRALSMLALSLPSAAPAAANELLEQLEDAGALAEYAFYAEDASALERLSGDLAQLEAGGEHAELKAYYRGLTAYRLALLGSRGGRAAARAGVCVEELDRAIEVAAGFAEAYALQAACFVLRAELEPLKAVLYRPLADRRMQRALELAGDNPRVLLLDAIRRHRRERPDETNLQRFETALARFETEAARPQGWPRWGEAEAWMWVGAIELARLEIIAARNALEQALLIAPHYTKAKELLRQIANRSQ